MRNPPSTRGGALKVWKGFWRLADPRLTLASVSSMLIGFAAAAHAGPVDCGWFALCVGGIVSLEIAKNASGEITDFDSGADLGVAPEDRSPFSGGRRVLVDRLLTRRQTRRISAATYFIGIAAGLIVALWREPRMLWIGIAGVALAWSYAGWPFRLAYRGLGEAAVAAAYGPLICCGTYLVQRHALSWNIAALSVPVGLLVGAFLWINEFPDYQADRRAGKRNWVVRLGRARASRWFLGFLAASFVLQGLLPWLGLPSSVRWGLIGAPFAWAAAARAIREPNDVSRIILAQKWTLQSFVTLSLATSLALILGAGR